MSRLAKQLLIFHGILLVAVVAVQVWRGLGPANALQKLEQEAKSRSAYAQMDTLSDVSELKEPFRERAYTATLKKWSKMDSIYLLVNLRDSAVSLFINGVTIHENKLPTFQLDPVFTSLSNRAYLTYFGQPISILRDTSTIVKEPIVVRQAPKDTIEAALNAYKPDTLYQNPAFWQIELAEGLDLIFVQDADRNAMDAQVRSEFMKALEQRESTSNLIRFFTFKSPYYRPKIIIPLPVGDLRAIYRALPEQESLLLRF